MEGGRVLGKKLATFDENWEKIMISMIFDALPKEKWDFTCQKKGEIIDR